MMRTTTVLGLLAMLAGCVSTGAGPGSGDTASMGHTCGHKGTPSVPGVVGPWGQPVPMQAPYTASPPAGASAAYAMFRTSMPLNSVQLVNGTSMPGAPSGVVPAGGGMPGVIAPALGVAPPGLPNMPALPGMTPPSGPAGPSSPPPSTGIVQVGGPPGPPGAVAAVGALTGGSVSPFPNQRTEVYFTNPLSMRVTWYAPNKDGKTGFSGQYLEVPGRYNFVQGAIYRLKLTDLPNRPGLELYPTLEVVPTNSRTAAFLAHSAVPVNFTDDDFEQVASGNYVVKVIYLPDPQYQDIATTGPGEVVSSQLEPGVDPITEATRRGSILLVVRLGNINLELPHSPAMDAPSAYVPKRPAVPAATAGMMPPPGMPYPGAMPPGMMMMPRAGMPIPGMMPPGMGVPGMGMVPGGAMPGPVPPTTTGPAAPVPGTPAPAPFPAVPTAPGSPANPMGPSISRTPGSMTLPVQYQVTR